MDDSSQTHPIKTWIWAKFKVQHCPVHCQKILKASNNQKNVTFIENISFPFPVPLQWAASVVPSLDIQSDTSCSKCSVACLWQTANVINGFITHRRHMPCCWQEAHVRTKTNPTQNNTPTVAVTKCDTHRCQKALDHLGQCCFLQAIHKPSPLLMPSDSKSKSNVRHCRPWQLTEGDWKARRGCSLAGAWKAIYFY